MLRIFEKFFLYANSDKGKIAPLSINLDNIVYALNYQKRIEDCMDEIFTDIITPLFKWIFNEDRLQANWSEPVYKLRKEFFEIV